MREQLERDEWVLRTYLLGPSNLRLRGQPGFYRSCSALLAVNYKLGHLPTVNSDDYFCSNCSMPISNGPRTAFFNPRVMLVR